MWCRERDHMSISICKSALSEVSTLPIQDSHGLYDYGSVDAGWRRDTPRLSAVDSESAGSFYEAFLPVDRFTVTTIYILFATIRRKGMAASYFTMMRHGYRVGPHHISCRGIVGKWWGFVM